jgi:hypothetical protein
MRVQADWIKALETGKDFSIDFRIRRADGAYRWFQTRAVAIRDQSDKILKWFGVNTDVEDLIQADQHVRTLNTALERRDVLPVYILTSSVEERDIFNSYDSGAYSTSANRWTSSSSPKQRASSSRTPPIQKNITRNHFYAF